MTAMQELKPALKTSAIIIPSQFNRQTIISRFLSLRIPEPNCFADSGLLHVVSWREGAGLAKGRN